MPDVALTLGGTTFNGFEIPETINFGGTQRTMVHHLVGGARQVDVLGSDPDDINWGGRFRGATAADRAQALDRMRIAGKPVTLSWGQFTYQVVISRFEASFQRTYEIPYRITCIPTSGDAQPVTAAQSVDSLVSTDMSSATGLLSGLTSVPALSNITDNLTSASSLIAAAGTLTGKSSSQTATILTYLGNTRTALQGAVQVADGKILTGAAQIGGVLPSSPGTGVTSLSSQIGALQSLSSLVVVRGTVGRLVNNVSQASAST